MQRMLGAVTSFVLLWSCHPSEAPMLHPPHRIWGLVHLASHATTKGSLVIVTDLATSKEIATTRVNSDETFEVNTSAAQIALTITSPMGWAYLPKVDVNGRKLDIQMSSECAPLKGKIYAESSLPHNIEPIRIARGGDNVGDVFAASLDQELQFAACLPHEQYQVFLPPQFANRLIATAVPQQAPLLIHAVSAQSARATPRVHLNLEHTSQDGFVQQLPDTVRLLGLGETNHGTREFILERTTLMLALARERGFTTVLIEAATGNTSPANAYIHGATIDLDVAISRIGFWTWKVDEFREALRAFRAYNQTVAPDRQISIRGIDVQQPAGAISDLLAGDIGLTPHETELLAQIRDQDIAAWNKFSQNERESTRRSLEKIASRRDHRGLAAENNHLALSAQSLLFSLDFFNAKSIWDELRTRDAATAQLVLSMFDMQPGLRATLWAHLGHLSRENVVGIPSLGYNLSAALRERFQVYALLAYEGAARAKDFQRLKLPAIAFPIAAAPPYALEGALASSAKDGLADVTYWNFGVPSARTSHWLNELHWIRSFGGAYPGDERSHELYNLGAIDGAVLFKTVTPTRLLNLPTPPPPASRAP